MNFDNRVFDITGEDPEDLAAAVAFAFAHTDAESYLNEAGTLVLFWTEAHGKAGRHALPYTLDKYNAGEFIRNWLAKATPQKEEPVSFDGSYHRGFRISNGPTFDCVRQLPKSGEANVEIWHDGIARVEAVWTLYGK